MNKEFIPYEQALALKELGFDEDCLAYYSGQETHSLIAYWTISKEKAVNEKMVIAPLYQQAFRWFREEFGLWVEMSQPKTWLLSISDKKQNKIILLEDYDNYVEPTSYEEAELACLKKLIQIVNQNK